MRQLASIRMRNSPAIAAILYHLHSIQLVTGLPGGAKGDRTPDLGIANAALSQLSYRPFSGWKGFRAGPKTRQACHLVLKAQSH